MLPHVLLASLPDSLFLGTENHFDLILPGHGSVTVRRKFWAG